MRPVPNFVVLFDKWLYGTNATGFFFTSIFFHTACVLTVYFFVKQILQTYLPDKRASLIPFITALLFLCYPYHAEPLMWVIARVSIIAAMLTFLSLQFYIKAAALSGYYFLSWLCFVIALFTYESIWNIVLLFAVISVADIIHKRVSMHKAGIMFGIMLLTFITYLGVRIWALNSIAGDGYLEINENLNKIALLLINLLKLAGRNFTPPFIHTSYAVIFFSVSAIVYAFITYSIFKRNKHWGWLMLLTWLAMITGVLTAAPLGIDTHYNESERYLYYSSFFYCFFIAFAISVFIAKKYQFSFAAIIVLSFLYLFSGLQKNYSYASAISKTTLETVAKYPERKRAFFIDVPKRYKGSMIFRISLPEAIKWIVPQAKYDSVIVVSQVETALGKIPFKTGEASWQQLAITKGFNTNTAVINHDSKTDTISNNDIIFWFKEDGIYKVNLP